MKLCLPLLMPTTSKVSHAQAYSAFETALTWLEEQDNTDSAHLLLVQKWRICSGETYSNQKKQQCSVKLYYCLLAFHSFTDNLSISKGINATF